MIRSNFTKLALLANTEIVVGYDTPNSTVQYYNFRMPTVRETTEFNFYTFLTFCILDEARLKEWFKNVEFETRYDLMKAIMAQPSEFRELIALFLKRYWLNCNQDADEFFNMPKEIFDLFCLYLAVACGQKKFEEVAEYENDYSTMTPEEIEWKKREKEYNDLISKARAKAKESDAHKGAGNELVIAAVVHDFGFSMDEVLNMNFYTLYYYFGLTEKLASYNVDLIATGTGSVKKGHKHKYWVNI